MKSLEDDRGRRVEDGRSFRESQPYGASPADRAHGSSLESSVILCEASTPCRRLQLPGPSSLPFRDRRAFSYISSRKWFEEGT
jgi:hypothetical protein